ncbi:hypothetical protein CCR75_004377 [Bremia lactucae]|uniref:Uncharacterized protein n=1 Tax=Bremia lactucae TaxID=4779 RepID=A0A976FJI8_BRELC|nr:hypothetical protein CCR75_004377 [Bremia lactucae]
MTRAHGRLVGGLAAQRVNHAVWLALLSTYRSGFVQPVLALRTRHSRRTVLQLLSRLLHTAAGAIVSRWVGGDEGFTSCPAIGITKTAGHCVANFWSAAIALTFSSSLSRFIQSRGCRGGAEPGPIGKTGEISLSLCPAILALVSSMSALSPLGLRERFTASKRVEEGACVAIGAH